MAQGTVKLGGGFSTETPTAMFNLGSYIPAHSRLVGLTWGAEDLGAAIGATGNKELDGSWTFPYKVARAQCLFAAAAAEVAPIDTLYARLQGRRWPRALLSRSAPGRVLPDELQSTRIKSLL